MSSYGLIAPIAWPSFLDVIDAPTPRRVGRARTVDAIAATLVDVPDAPGFARGFYTQRGDGAHSIGVAGYKSRLHALDALFVLELRSTQDRYACTPRPDLANSERLLLALVARLALGQRRRAGVPHVLDPAGGAALGPSWPAHDAALLLGWLSPTETRLLAQRLPAWEARARADDIERLAERIRAASAHARGLVGLHAML